MKGMQKIKRGTGFRGVLDYALDKDKGELIGGNMSGETPKELAAEFGYSRRVRPDIEKPVWHQSLRLPEGEKIDRDKWVRIADSYMQKMGFNELHQRAYILHDDKAGQHIHIIASRIDLKGNIFYGVHDSMKSTPIIAHLEKIYNLTPTNQERDPEELDRKRITAGEKGIKERTGEKTPKEKLQSIIDQATTDKPQLHDFVKRLNSSDVSILPSGKTGTPQGISFELDGIAFKGSSLGKDYAWKQLNEKRIDYDKERDQGMIDQLRQDPSIEGVKNWIAEREKNKVVEPKQEKQARQKSQGAEL